MELYDKVAIVTGGASGIGKAIVFALGEAGAKVSINYRTHKQISDAEKEQVSAMKDRIIGVQADISQISGISKVIDETVKAFGRIDILINNAGIETRTSVLDTTESQYDRVLAVNLKGAFFLTQLAARQMIEQGGGGRIINISSIHEDWPMPGNSPYCLSKGGMRMLTRNAGVELAAHGITVVGVAPGAVATPINIETMQDPGLMQQLNAVIPLGRMATPKEIADLVVWLASDQASYVTATTFTVDGGMMQFSLGL